MQPLAPKDLSPVTAEEIAHTGQSHAGKSNHRRSLIREQRKLELIRLILHEHPSLSAALRDMNWSRPSYQNARRADPTWAAKVDAALGGKVGWGQGRPSRAKWEASKGDRVAAVEAIEATDDAPHITATPGGFAHFRKAFFGMDSTWFHLRAVDVLERSEPGSITMLLWPPEHGKSTLLEDWICFKLAQDPEFRIIVVSERQAHAVKILRRVKQRMDPSGPAPDFVSLYGPFMPQKGDEGHQQTWAATHFDVFKRHGADERDFNASAVGFGSAIAGTRCDLLLVDDVQSLKSLGQSDAIVEQFRQDWLSRPGSKGRTVIIGTRVGEDDVYEKLIDEGLIDDLVRFSAFDDQKDDWPAPDTRCLHPKKLPENIEACEKVQSFLWPERYTPRDYLNMRLTAGEGPWARNFMQKPTSAGSRTFEADMLADCSNKMRRYLLDLPEGVQHAIIGWDPGFGTNAFMVGGFTKDLFCPLEWRRDRGLTSTEQMAQILDDLCHAWLAKGVRVVHLVIEDKAFQKGLLQDASVRQVQKTWGFTISGHTTSDNKYDEDLGVAAMARSFLVREIELPGADDPATLRARGELDAELLSWRPYRKGTKLRQDLVMALWFSWMRWRSTRQMEPQMDRTPIIRMSGLGVKPVPMVSFFGGKRP